MSRFRIIEVIKQNNDSIQIKFVGPQYISPELAIDEVEIKLKESPGSVFMVVDVLCLLSVKTIDCIYNELTKSYTPFKNDRIPK